MVPLTPLNVLLVEDNAADASIIEEMVRDTGVECSVLWLKDGEVVLRHLREGHGVDVIILDLNMPRMDGHALLGHLKELNLLHRIAIVVMTGSSSPLDKERVRKAGVTCYLIKPMGMREMEETTATLRSILQGFRPCYARAEHSAPPQHT
ncbi:MAG: response regulator [Methanomassiliicoccus sp.]|nr:response regulator [Methanomassiliicoccus sp.]